MTTKSILEKAPGFQKTAGIICWIDPDRISHGKPSLGTAAQWSTQGALALVALTRLFIKTVSVLLFSRLHIILLEGKEKSSQQAIQIAYVGDKASYHYLINLLFTEPPEVIDSRRSFWLQLGAELRRLSQTADLSVLDLDFPLPLMLRRNRCLNVPRWVKQRVPIGATWEEVMSRMRRKTRREAQRVIRKFGFRSRVMDGRHAAEHFYDRLYRPYIRERHGQAAEIVSRERFIRECRRSQIIQLLQGDKVLAAVATRLSGRLISIGWTGMDTELSPEQRLGAADALDFFTLIYAYQYGCEYLDMGHSRACLDNGVLRYKRKWGAEIYRKKTPQGSILINPLSPSPAVLSLLASVRFITLDGGQFVCRTILPMNLSEEKLKGFLKYMWVDGLQRIRLFSNETVSSKVANEFPWAEFITIKTADNPLEHIVAPVPLPGS
jgi:hypothetical protein